MQVFPRSLQHGTSLQSAAADINKGGKEVREDIKSRALNYHSMLSAELKRGARYANLLDFQKGGGGAGGARILSSELYRVNVVQPLQSWG